MIEVTSFILGWLAGIFMTQIGVIIALKLVEHSEKPIDKD